MRVPAAVPRRRADSIVRRRRVRERFDASVEREWGRYTGEAWRVLVGELRDRFLRLHLPHGPGWVLEIGPGPGRFTPSVLSSGARVAAVDLSMPMLRTLGKRIRRGTLAGRLRRVRGAGEHLPFRDGAFRAAVAYGNILGFAAGDADRLLAELGRVVRTGGVLVLDVSSPVAATTEFLSLAAERRILLRILHDPDYYFLSGIMGAAARAHQPFAPERMAYWEFDFYTVPAAESAIADAGFLAIDRMAVGAIAAFRGRVAKIARRDPSAWRALLELEEKAGRRPGVLETGHGFVVAAVRRPSRPPRRSRA
jgi:ubiquinone/menaquinone biosynthesis C-methylase UbiE